MKDRHAQLTIPLHQQALSNFDNFYTGRNAELVERLRGLAEGRGAPGLWLWGEPGRGRSHLLQATCQAAEAGGARALYLPLALLPRDPLVLEGLQADLVAVDDLDAWLGDESLEVALMALYQERLQAQAKLLCAAIGSAQQSLFVLPDLASRLRALPGYEVFAPDDAGLRAVLRVEARRRGLLLGGSVLDFWLHRTRRSLPHLLAQLDQLDGRALAEQRAVTIPLIKEVLAL